MTTHKTKNQRGAFAIFASWQEKLSHGHKGNDYQKFSMQRKRYVV